MPNPVSKTHLMDLVSLVLKYWCTFLPSKISPSIYYVVVLNIFNIWTNRFSMEGCFTSYTMKMKYSCCTEFTSKVILSNGTVFKNKILSFDSKNYLFQAI